MVVWNSRDVEYTAVMQWCVVLLRGRIGGGGEGDGGGGLVGGSATLQDDMKNLGTLAVCVCSVCQRNVKINFIFCSQQHKPDSVHHTASPDNAGHMLCVSHHDIGALHLNYCITHSYVCLLSRQTCVGETYTSSGS